MISTVAKASHQIRVATRSEHHRDLYLDRWRALLEGAEGRPSDQASEPVGRNAGRRRSRSDDHRAAVGQVRTLLAGKIIEADLHAAEEEAKIWEAERFVRAGNTKQSGLKLLIAKANAGDVILFMATVNRIAEILRMQGDMDQQMYAAQKPSAFSPNPRWRRRCCENSEPSNARSLSRSGRMNPSTTSRRHPSTPLPRPPADEDVHDFEPVEQEGETPFDPEATESSAGCGLILQPTALDVRKLRLQVILHIHLSEEALASYQCDTSRFGGGSPGSKASDRSRWVRSAASSPTPDAMYRMRCKGCSRSSIRRAPPPVDGYEIPRRIREASRLMARWQVRQPEPGVWIWRSPHGSHYVVSNTGTQRLGKGAFARQLWRIATARRPRAPTAG
jgi:hypothetical protein